MLTIRRALEAKKAARENGEEAGFSLIELIIVVVILGILVAIAIPIFANIQNQAKINALKAAAANGASAAATAFADPTDNGSTAAAKAASAGDATQGITTSYANTKTPASIDGICVTATGGAGWPPAETSGPGC
jgi:type IV pilus assembly protein PilA